MSYIKDLRSDIEWRRKDAIKMSNRFEVGAYVIDGVVRWKSNDSVPPQDILELWKYEGKDFDYVKSVEERQAEMRKSIEEYKKQMENYSPTAEELFQMRSAFGEGATVVNAITGTVIQL
jgi:hypothetical protein